MEETFELKYNNLVKQITLLQEDYDENGYDCPPDIKLQRIDQHIKSVLKIWKNRCDILEKHVLSKEESDWVVDKILLMKENGKTKDEIYSFLQGFKISKEVKK